LVKRLAARRYEDVIASVHDPDSAWTATRVAAEMQPYFDGHASIVTTPESRRPHLTTMRPDGDGALRVAQRFLDPKGDDDWVLEGRVDLARHPSGERAGLDDRPIVELIRIGN
jgi:hypothetical protein